MPRTWTSQFGGKPAHITVKSGERSFEGKALVRVRAVVQHDSYERLLEIPCNPERHVLKGDRSVLLSVAPLLEDARHAGIDVLALTEAAERDPAIAEFCRFYLERRSIEEKSAGDDDRKRHKLREDFTPRLELEIVGLDGIFLRRASLAVSYTIDNHVEYGDEIAVDLDAGSVIRMPELRLCAALGKSVPVSVLEKCCVTGVEVIRHQLAKSELSGRYAKPDCLITCALSGQRILKDEADISSVTGAEVQRKLLKTSALSGKRAEPEHFGKCAFSEDEVLLTELARSDVSARPYRSDQSARSEISGLTGHRSEFLMCQETRKLIAKNEAEQCEVTEQWVRKGVLQPCAISGKRAVPSALQRCEATDQLVLPSLLVTSSVFGRRLLRTAAIASASGKSCLASEVESCRWSGRKSHPDDLAVCGITGLRIHSDHLAGDGRGLAVLVELLSEIRHTADAPAEWQAVAARLETAMSGRARIEAAALSPDKSLLGIRAEMRTLFGLRSTRIGFLYSMREGAIVGRIARPENIISHQQKRA